MAVLLNKIIAIGGTTAYRGFFDAERINRTFVTLDLCVSCFVAVEGSRLFGFQALAWSDPEWPGNDRLPEDWAIVATYVDPEVHGSGVGRAMFAETLKAAKAAGVRYIDATIMKENTGGLAFYQAMGFEDYRISRTSISKRLNPNID